MSYRGNNYKRYSVCNTSWNTCGILSLAPFSSILSLPLCAYHAPSTRVFSSSPWIWDITWVTNKMSGVISLECRGWVIGSFASCIYTYWSTHSGGGKLIHKKSNYSETTIWWEAQAMWTDLEMPCTEKKRPRRIGAPDVWMKSSLELCQPASDTQLLPAWVKNKWLRQDLPKFSTHVS